tara:strand:+ start:7843 stop:8235 length:393 start_codon:yes stop_codon:yes gene_type:complete
MNRYDYSNPNLNFQNDKICNLVNKLIYKGQILEWKEKSHSNYFRDSWGKFKVTSVTVNSWGSIYVNIRVVDGEYYNKPLSYEFTNQKTAYRNKQVKDRWKWTQLTSLVYKELKLMGIPGGKIFIKRLTVR